MSIMAKTFTRPIMYSSHENDAQKKSEANKDSHT